MGLVPDGFLANQLPEVGAVTITARCPFCEQVERHRGTGSFIQSAVQWLVDHVVEKHLIELPIFFDGRGCWIPGCRRHATVGDERHQVAFILQHYDDRHAALFATMTDITTEVLGGYSL